MFKFADRGSIEDALSRNKFRNIEERHITLPRIWAGSLLDFWQYFQEISTLFQPLMRAIPESMRPNVDEAVGIALARFQQGNIITVPTQVVIATAEC
jgi:hypothetical protein